MNVVCDSLLPCTRFLHTSSKKVINLGLEVLYIILSIFTDFSEDFHGISVVIKHLHPYALQLYLTRLRKDKICKVSNIIHSQACLLVAE